MVLHIKADRLVRRAAVSNVSLQLTQGYSLFWAFAPWLAWAFLWVTCCHSGRNVLLLSQAQAGQTHRAILPRQKEPAMDHAEALSIGRQGMCLQSFLTRLLPIYLPHH